MVPSIQPTMAIVNCRNSPLRSSNFSWVGGVSLVQDPYFLTQNVWMKSVSPSALTAWRASLSCWNNGFPFLTEIDVPDIANGSPTTLSPHLLIDLYSRLTSSAINTSSFLCKYKNRNSCKVRNLQFNCTRLLMIFLPDMLNWMSWVKGKARTPSMEWARPGALGLVPFLFY